MTRSTLIPFGPLPLSQGRGGFGEEKFMGLFWTILRVCLGIYRHPKQQYKYAIRFGISARELDRATWVSMGPNGGQWGT